MDNRDENTVTSGAPATLRAFPNAKHQTMNRESLWLCASPGVQDDAEHTDLVVLHCKIGLGLHDAVEPEGRKQRFFRVPGPVRLAANDQEAAAG